MAGYAVLYGTNSGSYQTRVDVGNRTNATIQLPTNGDTFFFVTTAYTVDGLESLPSNEVSYTPPASSINQTITFGALPAKSFGDAAFPLSATASSGLPVSFTSGNPSVATISGNMVTLVGAGSAVITASQGGDGNYSAAANVTQTLTVDDAPPGELLVVQTPDGLNQRLRFSVGPGRHWQLQASVDSFHWDTLCELDAVTNGWIDVFDPIIPSQPNWSYRLVNAPSINTNQGVDVMPGALLLSRTDTPLNMQLRFSIGAEPPLAAAGE